MYGFSAAIARLPAGSRMAIAQATEPVDDANPLETHGPLKRPAPRGLMRPAPRGSFASAAAEATDYSGRSRTGSVLCWLANGDST
jgi:hypothetical protein